MTAAEETRAQLEKMKARAAEYKAQLETAASSDQRAMLRQKITSLNAAMRDVREQLRHLEPQDVAHRRSGRMQKSAACIERLRADFFGAAADMTTDGPSWDEIEGQSWDQLEAGDYTELGTTAKQLQKWMAEAGERLTGDQKKYLDAYYNEGLSMEHIAQRYGVDRSTVSRSIRRGLARMQEWTDSRKLGADCTQPAGRFDWVRYLLEVGVLTDRERQTMLLLLSGLPQTQGELSDKMELDQSTVCRAVQRATKKLGKLEAKGEPVSRPVIEDWEHAGKLETTLQTGMPLNFYYKFCFADERIGGLTRYQYEIARRRAAGISPAETARELGMKLRTAQHAYSWVGKRLRDLGASALPPDTIGAKLDPETYVKLQRLVTRRC